MPRKAMPYLIFCFLILNFFIACAPNSGYSQQKSKKYKEKCWSSDDENTLIAVMNLMLKTPLERSYVNNDYIQTFGCAYEDDDIEQNSIRAVYRAIDQSLRNRRVAARDNIIGLLRSNPPRPDNLTRDYTLYVNLVKNSDVQQARYEVKILDLEVVPTFESSRAVWTRVITRYAYQDDFKNAPSAVDEPSEFVAIMVLAEQILEKAGKGDFKRVDKLISNKKKPTFHPSDIRDLVFGDYLSLFSERDAKLGEIPAVYIGKGIYIAKIEDVGSMVLKFGEEHLFGLRLDTSSFRRATSLFVNLQYQAPESVLQCILLRFNHKKPLYLPSLEAASR